jgi:hypothetical protein
VRRRIADITPSAASASVPIASQASQGCARCAAGPASAPNTSVKTRAIT